MKGSFSLCSGFILLLVSCFTTVGSKYSITQNKDEIVVLDSFTNKLILAAISQTKKQVTYNGSYFVIPYPNGDIPDSLGVCTDVIIRAYRKVGYDLQKLVHEDMKQNFAVYNKRRITQNIDRNIDHRRVPNLETFFTRMGAKLVVLTNASDYKPGDIVCWDIAAGHIGIVTNIISERDSLRLKVVHNIGSGPALEDYLFSAKITGHYRWTPWAKKGTEIGE